MNRAAFLLIIVSLATLARAEDPKELAKELGSPDPGRRARASDRLVKLGHRSLSCLVPIGEGKSETSAIAAETVVRIWFRHDLENMALRPPGLTRRAYRFVDLRFERVIRKSGYELGYEGYDRFGEFRRIHRVESYRSLPFLRTYTVTRPRTAKRSGYVAPVLVDARRGAVWDSAGGDLKSLARFLTLARVPNPTHRRLSLARLVANSCSTSSWECQVGDQTRHPKPIVLRTVRRFRRKRSTRPFQQANLSVDARGTVRIEPQ